MAEPNYRPFWGMLAFAGLFLLVITVPGIQEDVRLGFDLGTRGTYVVVDEPSCGSKGCYSHKGTFFSDNGEVTRTDVGLANRTRGLKLGDRVPVIDIGDENAVHRLGTGDLGLSIVVTVFATAALVIGIRQFRKLPPPPAS